MLAPKQYEPPQFRDHEPEMPSYRWTGFITRHQLAITALVALIIIVGGTMFLCYGPHISFDGPIH
jgi:hypothetical protein